MTLGLSSGVTTAWWLTLGVGLVVALVVATLLELLRRTVHEIRRGVDDVLTTGGRLAQNTWTVQLLRQTHTHADDLLEELRSHRRDERSDA
jgi:hypothetical protein